MQRIGITVIDCEQDEEQVFYELAPRFSVSPTIIRRAAVRDVIASGVIAKIGNRCLSVSHKTHISEHSLSTLHRAGVRYLSTRSIGLDHIDLKAAGRLGITVTNCAYSPDGVADYTLMLMLMALRNAPDILDGVAAGDFRLPDRRGSELNGMTVGIVGYGRIGQAVTDRLRGFGCRVLVHDKQAGSAIPLSALLQSSDIVSLHLPLTSETFHIIGQNELLCMKRGALLVNTGRGALVDTEALISALINGRLIGAALDVLEGEENLFYRDCSQNEIDESNLLKLRELPNVLITPHTAYYTRGALYDTVNATLQNCLNFERRQYGA